MARCYILLCLVFCQMACSSQTPVAYTQNKHDVVDGSIQNESVRESSRAGDDTLSKLNDKVTVGTIVNQTNFSIILDSARGFNDVALDLYRFEELEKYKKLVSRLFSAINQTIDGFELIENDASSQDSLKQVTYQRLVREINSGVKALQDKAFSDKADELKKVKLELRPIDGCSTFAKSLRNQFAIAEYWHIASFITDYKDCLANQKSHRSNDLGAGDNVGADPALQKRLSLDNGRLSRNTSLVGQDVGKGAKVKEVSEARAAHSATPSKTPKGKSPPEIINKANSVTREMEANTLEHNSPYHRYCNKDQKFDPCGH